MAAKNIIVDDTPTSKFSQWYRGLAPTDREELNRRRRERYRADVGGLASKQRTRVRNRGTAERKQRRKRERVRTSWRKVSVLVGGKARDVYVVRTRELSLALKRSSRQLTRWYQGGVIPAPMYRTRTGLVLWTESQRDLLVEAAKRADMLTGPARGDALATFTALVQAGWKAIPEGVGDGWQKAMARIEG